MQTGPDRESEIAFAALDGLGSLLAEHRALVARFGLGVTPALSFRQVLARVVARNDRAARPAEAALADSRSPLP